MTLSRNSIKRLMLGLTVCGSLALAAPMPVTHAASPTAARHARVTIQNFAFAPATLKIKVGTTVVWTNKDSVTHTVTGLQGHWGSDNLDQGQTYAHTFKKTGTYLYRCAIHPSMTAKVIVVAAPTRRASAVPADRISTYS